MSVTIYHNPRCSKSRAALALLEEKGVATDIVEYLKTPPSVDELRSLINMLGISVRDVMRKGEAVYKELSLGDPDKSDDVLIQAIVDNPILLERPIVVSGGKAAIGRPTENILKLI